MIRLMKVNRRQGIMVRILFCLVVALFLTMAVVHQEGRRVVVQEYHHKLQSNGIEKRAKSAVLKNYASAPAGVKTKQKKLVMQQHEEDEEDQLSMEEEEEEDHNSSAVLSNTIPENQWGTATFTPTSGQHLKNINLDEYTPEDREIISRRMPEMLNRAETLASVCKEEKKALSYTHTRFIWDLKHNLIYCPIQKTGSGTWIANFLRLAHFNEDREELRNLPPEEAEAIKTAAENGWSHLTAFDIYTIPSRDEDRTAVFSNSFKLIAVRHPFVRFVSGFRAKMVPGKHYIEPHIRQIQEYIIKHYRYEGDDNTSEYPTFEEFVNYVIDFASVVTKARQWSMRRGSSRAWSPYWASCSICALDFNIIVKLETLVEDEEFVISLAHLDELKDDRMSSKKNMHYIHAINNTSSNDVALEYFSQLKKNTVLDLYEVYKQDFILFDYDIEDFLNVAQP